MQEEDKDERFKRLFSRARDSQAKEAMIKVIGTKVCAEGGHIHDEDIYTKLYSPFVQIIWNYLKGQGMTRMAIVEEHYVTVITKIPEMSVKPPMQELAEIFNLEVEGKKQK